MDGEACLFMVDSSLFEQCKQKNAKAQRKLYDLYKARLMGLCRRYTRSREDAQDVLQESFIKIFSRIAQVDNLRTLEGWMLSIAVNTSIDHYHKHKKHETLQYPEENNEVAGDDDDKMIARLSDEFLVATISELPDGCRMVLNMFAIEGYSHAEIAERLSITEGTSRSQLHHAKYLLKKKLSLPGVTLYEKFA